MINNRWEMGSSFHEYSDSQFAMQNHQSLLNEAELYLSGRYALLDLMIYQHKHHGLLKLYIPSYYCHDITRLMSKIIEVEIYSCDPFTDVDLTLFLENSAVILVEYFGNKAEVKVHKQNLLLILDKTHNPFSAYSYNFSIDYTFGSLRKVLPLSDGGFLIPPVAISQLKPQENIKELKEAQKAMQLKKSFLAGCDIDKSDFLNAYGRFEEFLNLNDDVLPISTKSQESVFSIDTEKLLATKKNNLEYLNSYYHEDQKIKLFLNDCYFSFFINPEKFVELKAALIKAKVYPAILWPAYNDDYNLIGGDILISLHADFRYSLKDMKILTDILDGIFCDL